MEAKKVIVYDKYTVSSVSMLSDYDRKILTLLYQPLCGYGALSLYLTLWCNYESIKNLDKELSHKNLFDIMECNVEEFEIFRNRLEGLGLIKTFVKEDEVPVYYYELYSPLSPKEFFKHELLGTLLKQKLDEKDYDELRSLFVVVNNKTDNSYDVSHNFGEVYNLDLNDTTSLKTIITDDDNLENRKNGKIGNNFNLEIFLMVLKENQIKKSLISKDFIELMESMNNLYKLDEYEMCNILMNSIEGFANQEKINYETFKKKCYEYHKINKISATQVKALESKKKGLSKKTEMFQELDPIQFLCVKQAKQEASDEDIKLVEDLSLMSKLDPGVINVLLDYVMLNKQNTLPYKYVMKIASSLVQANVKNVIEAMEYFNSFKAKYSKKDEKEVQKAQEKVVAKPIEKETDADDDLEYEMLKKAAKEKVKNGTVEV